mmetsp:Transcript_8124/g.24482  ORF Transcript_8124/g.24482 Transcript_8124/m.24482 type:complete len:129 (+) Transcript_8124:73-459(+)
MKTSRPIAVWAGALWAVRQTFLWLKRTWAVVCGSVGGRGQGTRKPDGGTMEFDPKKSTATPFLRGSPFRWNSLIARGGMIWGGLFATSYLLSYLTTPDFNMPLYKAMGDSMEKQRRDLRETLKMQGRE